MKLNREERRRLTKHRPRKRDRTVNKNGEIMAVCGAFGGSAFHTEQTKRRILIERNRRYK